MFKLLRKIATLCIVLASTIVVNAQTQINWGTYVSTPPVGQNTGSSYQRDLAADISGNVFGAGNSQLTTPPVGTATTVATPVFDNTFNGQWDGYLYKISSDGKSLMWWTYIGGANNDDIWGIEYSKEVSGEYVYVSGFSDGAISIPAAKLKGGAKKSGRDAFLAKFDALTGDLVWFSWLGTSGEDCGFVVKISPNYVHLAGIAGGSGLPTTPGAYKTSTSYIDGFYARFDFSGTMNYCTYTGFEHYWMDINYTNGAMGVRGMDILSDNDVLLAGATDAGSSATEKKSITTGTLPLSSNSAGFVLRLKPNSAGATDLAFASLIRKASGTYTFATDVKYNNGDIYVLGYTDGVVTGIPTGAYQTTNGGGSDVFVWKISATTYALGNATMYGGNGNDYATSLNVCTMEPTFSGQTSSSNLPAVNALTNSSLSNPSTSPSTSLATFKGGGNDMFVASIRDDFAALSFATYLGGKYDEHPFTSYTLKGKTGGHALNGSNLIIGASSHSYDDMPTTVGAYREVGYARQFTAPDMDFLVSFRKSGGSCSLSPTTPPDLDLDANDSRATGKNYDTTFTENNTVGVKIGDTDTKVTDPDSPNLTSATIVLTNKFYGDTIKVGALTGGILSSVTSTGTTITITLNGSATQAQYQDAIQNIRFLNNTENPNTTDRKINVTVNDGSDPSNIAVATIHVVSVNDKTVLDLDLNNDKDPTLTTGYQTTYTENGTNVTIADTDIKITDVDNTTLKSAIIYLTNKFAGDTLFVNGTLPVGITATKNAVNANNIIITLKSTTSNTLAEYENAIKLLQFYNKTENPNTTDRKVKVQTFDGSDSSNTAIAIIKVLQVNDCPVLTNAASYTTTFTEKGAKVAVASSTLTISDPDLATVSSTQAWTATIKLTNGVALDSLFGPASANGFTVAASVYAYPNVTVSISGTGTGTDLATLIKAITYKSGSLDPSTTTRNISISVSDGTCPVSGASTISVVKLNDNPVLDLDKNDDSGKTQADFQTTFTEKGTGKNIADTDILITDVDNTTLNGAEIILTNKQVGDYLTKGSTIAGILATVSSDSSKVTLSGTATLAQYQTAIQTITFNSWSKNPSTTDRFVTVQVNDGQSVNFLSNLATTTIKFVAVNDNPAITLDNNNSAGTVKTSDFKTTYVEQSLTGVKIGDTDTKVTDVDSPNLTSATIILTNKFAGDTIKLGTTVSGISIGSVISTANTITISLSGSATLADYETVIKNIEFSNSSKSPDNTTRVVTVVVSDGSTVNFNSNIATSFINFTLINDCPIVDLNTTTNGNNDVATYIENASAVNIVGNNISIIDPDKTTQVWNVKVELSNAFPLDSLFKSANVGTLTIGNPDYTTIPGKISITISGTGTGVQIASAINGIKFKTGSENPDLTPRIINIDVSDDATPACKVSTVSTINIKAKNDCPVVDLNTNSNGNDYSTIFVEQGAKVNVTSSNISITDVDNTTQKWTAKVELSNAVSLDSLFSSVTVTGFTVNPISYTAGKVTVNITGTGTGVQLGSIISGISYKSGSLNPVTTPRTIVVSISDDSSCTATANSIITINLVNDQSSLTLDSNNSAGTVKKSDFKTTYTEQTTAVNIGDVDTKITDVDNITQSSATITLTNKFKGDIIKVGALTGGITASYDSSDVNKVVITLTGVATLANYQDAIRNINFQNNRDYVDTTTRVIEVTVTDTLVGGKTSGIATSFIKVINVNDTVIVKNESIQTNRDLIVTNALTTIIENDVDPDNDVTKVVANFGLTVTGIVQTTKHGIISIVGNNYVYNPNNYVGKDTAIFNVCDAQGACRKDTLFIKVNPISGSLKLDLDKDNSSTGVIGIDYNYKTTFTENNAHTGINIADTDVSIYNPDLYDMTTATIVLTNMKKGDTLVVSGALASGLTSNVTVSGSTITLTITTTSGLKDSTDYKNLLKQIQFNNIRDDVDTTTRILHVTVANTDGTSNLAISTIKVVNVNDTVIVKNESFTIKEDTQLTNTLLSLLANDTDPDGDVISIQTIVKNGNNGSFSITLGNFIYNPNKDFNGKDTIVVSVCDTKNACRNDSLFITVTPVNDNPILDLDKNNNHDNTSTVNYQTTFGETTTKVSVGDNDVYISDVDNTSIYSALIKLTNTKVGDSLIVIGTLPNGIKDSLYTIGDTTYIKLKGKSSFVNYQDAIKLVNFQHKDAIIDSTSRVIFVTVNDSLLNSNIAITTISIDNRSPLIVNDVYVTNEDVVLTKTLSDILKNDTDPEGAKLTVSSIVKNGSNGTFTSDGTNFTYNPKKDFNGKDTVVVSVCDIKNACKNDTLFITVVPVNDNPLLDLDKDNSSTKTVADYLTHYVENDIALSIGDVDVEITDVDNKTISSSTIKLVNSFAGDTLKVNGTIPNGITYTTSKIGDTIVVKFEGKASLTTYQNLIKQTNFSSSKDSLITTDRFVHVTVNDSVANSNLAITTITLENVNDNPIVTVTNLITKEDSTIAGKNKALLVNDKDPEGDKLVIKQIVKNGTNGSFVLTSDTTYSYTPNKDFNGKDTVVVSVCDPQGLCSNKTIIITVIPVNDNPILDLDDDNSSGKKGADYITTFNENGTSLAINDADISIKDVDNINLVSSKIVLTNTKLGDSLVIGTLPNGLKAITTKVGDSTIVSISGTATLVAYQDAISAIKFLNLHDDLDSTTRFIKVSVNDGLSTSNIATTTIKVNSINDDPIIKSDTLTVVEDKSVTRDFNTILANDKDPENTQLTVTGIVKNGTKGNVTFTNSSYTYNPNLNENGKDTVVFTVCDNGFPLPRLCKNDTLFINIIPVNDDPIVKNEYVTIKKNNAGVNVNFLANDSDVETTLISSGITKSATHGKVSNINLNKGTFTYVPDKYFVGKDTVIFTVCDQGLPLPAICKEDTIFITVEENNSNCTIIDLDGNNSSKQLGYDYETTFVENSAAINITDKDLYIWDIDENQTELVSAKIVLINTQAGDSMYYTGPVFPNITTLVAKVNNNWEITFSGLADTSYYRQAIAQIKFVNNRDDISGVRREIKFTLNDGSTAYLNGTCNNSATTYIDVVPVHDIALIVNEKITLKEDEVYKNGYTSITNNDYSKDGDSIIVSIKKCNKLNCNLNDTLIVQNGNHGKLTYGNDSVFTYSPNKNFNGKDTVVVKVCDKTMCSNDTLFIDIIPVNDSIIVKHEYHNLNQGQSVSGSIITNDTNPDGTGVKLNNILIVHQNNAINPLGTLTVFDNGQYTYVANRGVSGTDIYVYTVCSQPGNYSCKNDTLYLKVGGEVIPTGFSPNGNGENDTYKISFPASYGTASVEIYNRWGAIVFANDNYPNSTNDYLSPVANEWDGNSNKGITIGSELPDGTYFVHLSFSNNSSANRIIAVTLQR